MFLNQIRLYDISAQRRPTISFDYLESPIKAVEADSNGYSIFVGTGNGDLATFDMRTGLSLIWADFLLNIQMWLLV